jgi:hypothetical protein
VTGPLAAADLDGTLIFSGRALGQELPTAGHRVVEWLDGAPSAWVAVAAVPDLTALADSGVLVPVTTRSLAQYRRIALPGPPPPWAVVANGGQLLRADEPDRSWESVLRTTIAAESAPTAAVTARLQPWIDRGWIRVVRDVDDLFTYAVAHERGTVPAGELADLDGWATARGLHTSVQGRKIYLVPRSLTKQAAVREVVERSGTAGFVAAGDSLLDAGLLDAAVAGIRPAHGELHATGWTRPHVTVTASSGAAAGIEIAAWLRGRVAPAQVRNPASTILR